MNSGSDWMWVEMLTVMVDWIGSVIWWIGLDWILKNGLTDISGLFAELCEIVFYRKPRKTYFRPYMPVDCCRPFLNASKRELLADCALPVSVLIMSFFGSYVFRDVQRKLTHRNSPPNSCFVPR